MSSTLGLVSTLPALAAGDPHGSLCLPLGRLRNSNPTQGANEWLQIGASAVLANSPSLARFGAVNVTAYFVSARIPSNASVATIAPLVFQEPLLNLSVVPPFVWVGLREKVTFVVSIACDPDGSRAFELSLFDDYLLEGLYSVVSVAVNGTTTYSRDTPGPWPVHLSGASIANVSSLDPA